MNGKRLANGFCIALIIGGLLIMGLFVVAMEVQAGTLYLPLVVKAHDGPLSPTATATPIAYPGPQWTVLAPVCPPGQVAPLRTFTDVGDTATLAGSHGITARAHVAGLQTLMVTCLTYDGTGAATVDIRLLKGNVLVAKLYVLDRAYDGEWLRLCIPYGLRDGDADRIAVYSTADGIYAVGQFEPPPTRPRPTRVPTVNPKVTVTATPKAIGG